MKTRHLHILRHALGLDSLGRGTAYRNYFITSQGSADYPECTALVDAGLMTKHAGSTLTGGNDMFMVTDAGRCAVRAEGGAT